MSAMEKLDAYAQAAQELAMAVQSDIRNHEPVSQQVVLALSRFVQAAQNAKKLLDQLERTNVKLN